MKKYITCVFPFYFLIILIQISQAKASDVRIFSYNVSLQLTDVLRIETELSYKKETTGNSKGFYLYLPGIAEDINVESSSEIKSSFIEDGRNLNKLLKVIDSFATSDTSRIKISYTFPVKKLNSRNIYLDDTEFYLLGDLGYLPSTESTVERNPCHFQLQINLPDGFKLVSLANRDLNDFSDDYPPTIIAGKFEEKQYRLNRQLIKVFIPLELAKVASVDPVINSVGRSDSIFSEIYGRRNQEELSVFFVDRSGGHGIDNGIILDQKYLKQFSASSEMIVAHEMAHLWWGLGVKSNYEGLMEALAEYSSVEYLGSNHTKITEYYSKLNLECEFENLNPVDFRKISPPEKFYSFYAYRKLPLIFHEVESIITKDTFLKKLASLYQRNPGGFISFENLIDLFEGDAKARLKYFIDGNSYPDFFIQSVRDDSVFIGGKDVSLATRIPCQITFQDNSKVIDTVQFLPEDTLQTKKYSQTIKRLLIDPEYLLNQKTGLNDLWLRSGNGSKYPFEQEGEYYVFGKKVTNFLFHNEPVLNDIAFNDQVSKELDNLKEKIKNVALKDDYTFINKNKSIFRILMVFYYKGKEMRGYIDGKFEDETGVKIKTIDNVKI